LGRRQKYNRKQHLNIDLNKSGFYQYKKQKQLGLRRRRQSFFAVMFSIFIALLAGGFFTLRMFQSVQTIHYTPTEAPLTNPLMGWAPWATGDCSQPFSLVYADLSWRDFEPQEGVYDFASFENRNQFYRWRDEGKRVVFRFVLDYPRDYDHLDIPDWLYEKIGQQGDRYANEYGRGFSPDYSNPILIDYHQKVIQKLAERYADDSFIAYIELGSLGHWGEWHVNTSSGVRQLPSQEIRDIYVSHYIESFPNTHMLMRRPFNTAKENNLGLFNDMTGDITSTSTWLDWIANGGAYDQTQEENGLSPMPSGWQVAPVGGEQSPSLSNTYLYQENLEQTINLLTQSHTSFIGPGSPCKEPVGSNLQPGLDQVIRTIGYRLTITKARLPYLIIPGNNPKINITITNLGLAPIYYNWPTRLYIFDYNQNLITSSNINLDLRSILPGTTKNVTANLPLGNLSPGLYIVGIAIIDPLTGEPAIHLALDNEIAPNIFTLGQLEVRESFQGLLNSFID
jgi:hypothetical protein